MIIRELEYQDRTLRLLDAYLSRLAIEQRRADDIRSLALDKPELNIAVPDFTFDTWEALRAADCLPSERARVPFSSRKDGTGRPVPNICFKVPTAGGKTYLAASAVSRILGAYLGTNLGFILWIVPNEAIYAQTKKQLSNRNHPYRVILDTAAAGNVKILEKDQPLDFRDISSNLCVMLLMLQSANRETKESLRLFRDRGNVHGFFPAESDIEGHRSLLERVPNLDYYSDAATFWPLVKDSLGNVLRIIRPVVILDEGHRATSDLALNTLYGMNPSFVLELSATPKDRQGRGPDAPPLYSNILVDISGADLDREGMIKMPLNVTVKADDDWRNTLRAAKAKLDELTSNAERLLAEHNRYIRPILLVQVERTGELQRDGSYVHAEDAKEWLVRAGLAESEIAIKSATVNELAAGLNVDLLSSSCTIRAIITKQALQEGWDCSFAYILCILAATTNVTAITQLTGRILRQPDAEKTGVDSLDESYVFCHHPNTKSVVDAVKTGLEAEGLADLAKRLIVSDEGQSGPTKRLLERRDRFKTLEIFLPRILYVDGIEPRDFDYDQDVLMDVEWLSLDLKPLIDAFPLNIQVNETQMKRIRLSDAPRERIIAEDIGSTPNAQTFDAVHVVRMISDVVSNAWVGRAVVARLEEGLRARGFSDDTLGANSGAIVEATRQWLVKQRDILAEQIFRRKVTTGQIQFHLRTDDRNWRMPHQISTDEPERSRVLRRRNDNPIENSLFAPIYEAEFDTSDEQDVAIYLDTENALTWWHRNVARQGHYAVQGWRREKVYPDFIFALQRSNGSRRIVVLEMKGVHLSGNPDTEYKKALLQLLSEHFAHDLVCSGKLEICRDTGVTVECDLVLLPEWRTVLPRDFLNVVV